MANNQIKFLRGTSVEYQSVTKDNDTFYYTTDDNKFYLGDNEIVGSSKSVEVSNQQPTGDDTNIWINPDNTGGVILPEINDDIISEVDTWSSKKMDKSLSTKAEKSKYGDTTINVGRKAGTTVGGYSTAEGLNVTASGQASHAEGSDTTASGIGSHAEGSSTTASGVYSHAEGIATIASGSNSHAEGSDTTASGSNSHAEGFNTTAIGDNSHTSGYYTKALHENEASYGKYNISNSDTLFSIGDGTADDARHNAFEITTTGGKLHNNDIATTNNISNPNLLINPDFKINQRGMSRYDVIYKSDGTVIRPYTVDRWRIMVGNANITDGKFVLDGTIIQVLENNIGTDFTASVSVSDGSATATYDDTTKTFTIEGVNATLNWAKLEIGNSATPFSPPDITTELLKCQRYYQVHNLARQRIWYYTTDTLVFFLPNKVPMRDGRTATINGTLGISALDNKSQSGFNFVIEWATADGIKVRAEKTAHGLTDAILYVNKSANSGYITIDAEIY